MPTTKLGSDLLKVTISLDVRFKFILILMLTPKELLTLHINSSYSTPVDYLVPPYQVSLMYEIQ